MAVDNRIKEWELVTNVTKNLFLQDQSMTMFDHESDGNFVRVIGTPGTDPGGIGNGWATTYAIAEALGTVDSRPAGTNPVFQLRAITGTWAATSGSATLTGTGGAASAELFAGRMIVINGKANKVYSTSGSNTITLYRQADFTGSGYTVYEVVTVAERLNGIQNGNYPDLSFSGAVLSYAGVTSVRNLPTSITAGNQTVTGSAGWRYVVCSSSGVITVETIPGAEITSDVLQYTPDPTFNSTYQGYYSSVNTTKRIIGVIYFTGSAITELIVYGQGKDKKDDYWYSPNDYSSALNTNDRLNFTGAFTKTWGTAITAVDNGTGFTDNEGFRVSVSEIGFLYINFTFNSVGVNVTMNRNGSLYRTSVYNNSGVAAVGIPLSLKMRVNKNDYFTFYISTGGTTSQIYGMEIIFDRA